MGHYITKSQLDSSPQSTTGQLGIVAERVLIEPTLGCAAPADEMRMVCRMSRQHHGCHPLYLEPQPGLHLRFYLFGHKIPTLGIQAWTPTLAAEDIKIPELAGFTTPDWTMDLHIRLPQDH